jgi:hypothetical protein
MDDFGTYFFFGRYYFANGFVLENDIEIDLKFLAR